MEFACQGKRVGVRDFNLLYNESDVVKRAVGWTKEDPVLTFVPVNDGEEVEGWDRLGEEVSFVVASDNPELVRDYFNIRYNTNIARVEGGKVVVRGSKGSGQTFSLNIPYSSAYRPLPRVMPHDFIDKVSDEDFYKLEAIAREVEEEYGNIPHEPWLVVASEFHPFELSWTFEEEDLHLLPLAAQIVVTSYPFALVTVGGNTMTVRDPIPFLSEEPLPEAETEEEPAYFQGPLFEEIVPPLGMGTLIIDLPVSEEMLNRAEESLRSGIPDWDALLALDCSSAISEVLSDYDSPREILEEMGELPREIYHQAMERFNMWLEGVDSYDSEKTYNRLLLGSRTNFDKLLTVYEEQPIFEVARADGISYLSPSVSFLAVSNNLELIRTFGPQLIKLHVDNREGIQKFFPEDFDFQKLKNLKIFSSYSGVPLKDFLENGGVPEEIKLVSVTDKRILDLIVEKCPNLKSLIIMGCRDRIYPDDIIKVSEGLPNLRTLILPPLGLRHKVDQVIANLKGLTEESRSGLRDNSFINWYG